MLQGQLIGTESELEGLKQIYTDSNIRVRTAKARVAELRRQIEKMGGKDEVAFSEIEQGDASLYPSIRRLPLLGVKWSDLYRQTRVQEMVFQTLTQASELARVEEAKEIPSVKVLDSAVAPEKKSFPPRLLIMFLCTFLALAGECRISFSNRWLSETGSGCHQTLHERA